MKKTQDRQQNHFVASIDDHAFVILAKACCAAKIKVSFLRVRFKIPSCVQGN